MAVPSGSFTGKLGFCPSYGKSALARRFGPAKAVSGEMGIGAVKKRVKHKH
jgi:hypothetical protein